MGILSYAILVIMISFLLELPLNTTLDPTRLFYTPQIVYIFEADLRGTYSTTV